MTFFKWVLSFRAQRGEYQGVDFGTKKIDQIFKFSLI